MKTTSPNSDKQKQQKLLDSIRESMKQARKSRRYSHLKKLRKMEAIVQEQYVRNK